MITTAWHNVAAWPLVSLRFGLVLIVVLQKAFGIIFTT
jgi:hypothetical protein